jgi:hypothetical protein
MDDILAGIIVAIIVIYFKEKIDRIEKKIKSISNSPKD